MTDNENTNSGTKPAGNHKLRSFLSDILGRVSWMSRAGLTHGDDRNLWTVFGYRTNLTARDLYVKYRRQDIAKTIVNAPADAIWTRPPKVLGDSAFVSAWNVLTKDYQLWSVLNKIDIMLGFSRFAIMVIGLDDGKPLSEPVVGTGHNILYVQPYSELGLTINDYDVDPQSPRFGLPMYYHVQINEAEHGLSNRSVTAAPSVNFRVHYSRVVHIAGDTLEDSVLGIPRLEPVYNALDDLLKTVGGAAETYWLTANRGMQFDVDKDMQLQESDLDDLSDEIDEYYHNLRRAIRTRGVKINELGSKVADPSLSVNTILSIIAATTRIPQRLLMGSEAGQLASEQDRANWAERINERRNYFAEPHALLPTMARFTSLGMLPPTSELTFEWPEAFILGPLERAQTSAQKARSAANLSRVLTDQSERGEEFINIDEARSIVGFGDETKILEDTSIEGSSVPQST